MGLLSSIGRLLVLIRRIIAVTALLILVVALFTPFYKVKVAYVDASSNTTTTDTYLYSPLYTYSSEDSFDIWDYNSDSAPTLVVLGITWILSACACFILVITAIRANRGRIMGIMAFGLTLTSSIATFFIPLGFVDCTYPDPGNTITEDNGPCSSIWGSTDDGSSWGMYYGWYFILVGCCACLAMFIVGLLSPNPVEEEEYTPITNYK